MGVDVRGIQVAVFTIGGALAGLSGALYAHHFAFVEAQYFNSTLSIFVLLFVLIGGTPGAYPTFSGFILGYLAYDYTHYHVHHHVPKTQFGKKLREHHMRHHFQDHRYGFGVSSPLWDAVMRTLPRRRKEAESRSEARSA